MREAVFRSKKALTIKYICTRSQEEVSKIAESSSEKVFRLTAMSTEDLEDAYKAMAKDQIREAEAREWCEGLTGRTLEAEEPFVQAGKSSTG